jgi:hypothetical protein
MFPSLAQVIAISARTAAILLLLVTHNNAQALAEHSISKFTTARESLTGIAIKLVTDSHVPIGVEVAPDDNNRLLDVTHSESTLGAELDRIVSLNPRYEWKISGKAINILPKGERNSVFDVLIEHFEKKSAQSVEMVHNLLQDPAVLKYLAARRTTAQLWITGSPPKERGSILIRNITLREALNQVLVETHGIAWTAFYMPPDRPGDSERIMMQIF